MLKLEDCKLYSEKSESEKLALAVAFAAAEKIFSLPVYESHRKEKLYTILKGGKNIRGLLNPLPKDAAVSQVMLVSFVGDLYNYVTVGLRGVGDGKNISWRVLSACAPGYGSIFNRDELSSIAENFKKTEGECRGKMSI